MRRAPSLAPTLALTLALLPGIAAADGFVPPEGCRLEMTVQLRSCTVSQHYRCSADAAGDQWAAYLDKDGPKHVARIDAETRWMESLDPQTGTVDRLAEEADAASLSTLLATGRDDFDFWTQADDGFRMHHVGFDALTGETVNVGGVPLEATRFELTTTDAEGQVLWTRKGGQYVSRAQRRFYGGVEVGHDWTGAEERTDDTPMQFAFPGQPGFGAERPIFGCDLLMTRAGQPGHDRGAGA